MVDLTNGENSEHLIPATLRLRNIAYVIHVLIDTGCLQTNISHISMRVTDFLNVANWRMMEHCVKRTLS